MVDLRGLEPLTFSMPWRCSTNCATGPYMMLLYSVCDLLSIVRYNGRPDKC